MEQRIDIDLLPLTSMALIVLLILMIISPHISRSSIEVKLPIAETSQERKTDRIIITLAGDGKIDVSGHEIKFEKLGGFLKKELTMAPKSILLIRADRSTPYSDIESILKIGQVCGAKRIAIGTKKKKLR